MRLKHYDRVLAEVNLVSSQYGVVDFTDNMIEVESFGLPHGFNYDYCRLLIALSKDYPESPPKDMYLEKGLKKGRCRPEHYHPSMFGERRIRKRGYAWYCIHFKSWNPSSASMIRGDNLLIAIGVLYDALKYD